MPRILISIVCFFCCASLWAVDGEEIRRAIHDKLINVIPVEQEGVYVKFYYEARNQFTENYNVSDEWLLESVCSLPTLNGGLIKLRTEDLGKKLSDILSGGIKYFDGSAVRVDYEKVRKNSSNLVATANKIREELEIIYSSEGLYSIDDVSAITFKNSEIWRSQIRIGKADDDLFKVMLAKDFKETLFELFDKKVSYYSMGISNVFYQQENKVDFESISIEGVAVSISASTRIGKSHILVDNAYVSRLLIRKLNSILRSIPDQAEPKGGHVVEVRQAEIRVGKSETPWLLETPIAIYPKSVEDVIEVLNKIANVTNEAAIISVSNDNDYALAHWSSHLLWAVGSETQTEEKILWAKISEWKGLVIAGSALKGGKIDFDIGGKLSPELEAMSKIAKLESAYFGLFENPKWDELKYRDQFKERIFNSKELRDSIETLRKWEKAQMGTDLNKKNIKNEESKSQMSCLIDFIGEEALATIPMEERAAARKKLITWSNKFYAAYIKTGIIGDAEKTKSSLKSLPDEDLNKLAIIVFDKMDDKKENPMNGFDYSQGDRTKLQEEFKEYSNKKMGVKAKEDMNKFIDGLAEHLQTSNEEKPKK